MASGDRRCERHPLPKWTKRTDAPRRVTGRRLQCEREWLFREEPLCRHCLEKVPPQYRPSTQRDHIVPLAEGGKDTRENTQGLCDECHGVKSASERLRGLARAR